MGLFNVQLTRQLHGDLTQATLYLSFHRMYILILLLLLLLLLIIYYLEALVSFNRWEALFNSHASFYVVEKHIHIIYKYYFIAT